MLSSSKVIQYSSIQVHLLGDDVRGATMEAVVSRMKTIQVAINSVKDDPNSPAMRFLAISATIPNVNDVSTSKIFKHS